MPKIKLTSLAVSKLAADKGKQVDYFDVAMPAFGVRVSPKGTRTYFVMLRIHNKLSRLSLGRAKVKDDDLGLSLRDARAKAAEWTEQAAKGIDPRQQRAVEKQETQERQLNTFEAVVDRFMKQHVEMHLAKSTHREYRRILCGPDTKRWAHKPVTSITRADVRYVLDEMVARGSAGAANNALAYLRKFFNWCAEKDLLEFPPTDRLKRPSPRKVGERTLNEEEIAQIWQAFDEEGGLFGDMFKILLLTGQRRSEVAGMRRSELSDIDGDNPMWEIPSSRTKNKRPHLVPLSPEVVRIIKDRPWFGDQGLLFTTTGSTPTTGFGRAKERIDQEVPDIPHWTLHDLRRTMVTMMNEHLGIAPHVVEACVNHISGGAKAGVAGVYNKALYMEDRRQAFKKWDELLKGLH